ncbi:MAG: biopolymer transporter ExbD [Nannocystaceae bacterium]
MSAITMTPEQAAFLAKKKAKQQARRGREEVEGELGMTSLMDIVSIIVIYLLKSYASDPVVINPTAGQKIPMASADASLQDGLPVFVSPRGITVQDKKVATLTEDGRVDPGLVEQHLIGPLFDAFAEEVDKAETMAARRGTTWDGRVILVGDQTIPFDTVVDVMYTAGRAGISMYSFCVIRKG